MRCESRVRLRVQMQHREQVLLRCDRRTPARGPAMGMERELLPVLLRRLLRVPEQGSLNGQALAQLSGGRLPRKAIER